MSQPEQIQPEAVRTLVPADVFLEASGLSRSELDGAVGSGAIAGLVDGEGRAVALFDDVLPALDELEQQGLRPLQTYDPNDVRPSYDATVDDDEPDPSTTSATWSMSWPDDEGGNADLHRQDR